MHRQLLASSRWSCRFSCTPYAIRTGSLSVYPSRRLHTPSVDYEARYAEKLNQRAAEKGLSVDELRAKLKEEEKARRERERDNSATAAKTAAPSSTEGPAGATSEKAAYKPPNTRKDSAPVQPLSSLLNVPKILSQPHTSAQVGGLWTAYHLSRSGGTGRGYVCAAIPLELYEKMAATGTKYPSFVVPVPRPKASDVSTALSSSAEAKSEETPYEFYFLQWDFHGYPPVPSALEDPFNPPRPDPTSGIPQTSTVLFTPLQEYKSRGSYATPYLVLTHYTDLAKTHGVVLMRGEITPSSAQAGAGVDGRYMLSQEDGQLLSMALQKFYLWDAKSSEGTGAQVLKAFHEKPELFNWEDLLKHANYGI